MRETKYRAWDKKLKEMFPVHELVFNRFDGAPTTIKGYTHDEKDVWNVHGGHKMIYANAPRYELLEYTGLKDKNGKGIYEGDILEDKWGYRFPVFFEDGCYKTDSEDFEKVNERQINYHNLKVIGNIYENPDLLEGIA